ncbi:MAG: Holliday junction resolvase RuvX [Sterolibacterium sp.]|nr:Holliday junction resolvase RuvX [Sterolibacterium sp.]
MPDAMSDAVQDSGSVLAFDFGLKRIGVALGETLLGQARPLTVINGESNALRFTAIARLVQEWQPVRLVVGLPCAVDGSEHELSRRCRRFAAQLDERYHLPVTLIDERFSSVEAETRLTRQGHDWRARKQQIDAVAAQIILQDFFDTHVPGTSPSHGNLSSLHS